MIRILSFTIEDSVLRRFANRRRNQLFGCIHAHNELTFLNRLLLFTKNSTADGELYDHAQSIQMWCVFQVLAGKIFETWEMLTKRISLAKPVDPIVCTLSLSQQANLAWLLGYFGDKNSRKRTSIGLAALIHRRAGGRSSSP